ncbi:MAG: glycerol-3-phosphate 1-O-acyltransferase PlsY [Lentisphaeria bacterium]|nr:glycerol-3-phosphate 1-O-acyltransferase PlsY [Lentisphaeria bacterium]
MEQPSFIYALTAVFLLGYLLGSVPWGLLIGFLNGVDIRTKGSKNIGSTNVTRILGGAWGKICFALDFLKGYLGVILGLWLAHKMGYQGDSIAKIWGGAGALLGHIFPFWLRFKGGKGVATGAGLAFAMAFWPIVLALLIWIFLEKKTHIVAIASLGAAAALALLVVLFHLCGWEYIGWPVIILIWLMVAIVFYRHKENIQRLMAGKENSFKKPAATKKIK